MDVLSKDIEVNTIINNLKINEEFLRKNYEIDEKIDLPLLQGNLFIKNNNLTFNLDELINQEPNINISGAANLDNLNYQLDNKKNHL